MLNISTMQMSSQKCKKMCEFFVNHFKKDWNVNSTLRVLIWDDDLKDLEKSSKIASKFLENDLVGIYNLKI